MFKKLTLTGKIVVGLFFLLIVFIMYTMFLKPEEVSTGPDLSIPAKLTFDPNKSGVESKVGEKVRKEATPVLKYCSFFSGYGDNRGIPITFDALIAPDYKNSLYYYEDPKTKEQYIPAYFISPAGNGLNLAYQFASEDYERLDSCVSPPEAGGTGGLILLGFPAGKAPQSSLIKVYGSIWWDSVSLNPAQQDTEAGAETGTAPVVKIANYDNLTNSQAYDPAKQTFNINTAVQVGNGIIRVRRLEFGEKQTRVWVELFNRSGRVMSDGWRGTVESCIRKPGEACSFIDDTPVSQDTEASGQDSNTNQISDVLEPDQPLPPSSTGATLAGYLTFPRFDADQQLQLELPDFNPAGDTDTVAPVIIELPNQRNSQQVETGQGKKQLQ